ncbi:MAG: succinate dehydrogenase/fumarate reductase transmembrane subunit [Desulfovibrio sp.]|nr:succinate dehydrogenase/fumarate reductase transmembrane subunit [Desulfovibrio sp.]
MNPRTPQEILSKLDFWQAFSGALLAIFVCVHLVLEGSVVISPVVTDFIGEWMEKIYVAQIVAPVILALILFHFWIAARKMPFRKGELTIFTQHSMTLKDVDTALWIVQVFTAIVILFGAFFHVYGVMSNMPLTVEKSHLRLHEGWLLFYTVFLPCTILHTGIGIYRIGVKYGIISKARRKFWRAVIWIGMGCYLVLGCCALTRVWFF